MELLLIELAAAEDELAMSGPEEELQERITILNKSLEDLAGRYQRNEDMLEVLSVRRPDRELAI